MNNNGNNGVFLTGFRIAEIVLCLVVVLVGVLYLYTDIVSLWMLLPVSS